MPGEKQSSNTASNREFQTVKEGWCDQSLPGAPPPFWLESPYLETPKVVEQKENQLSCSIAGPIIYPVCQGGYKCIMLKAS